MEIGPNWGEVCGSFLIIWQNNLLRGWNQKFQILINIHFLSRLIMGIDGCFPSAQGRQPTSVAAVHPSGGSIGEGDGGDSPPLRVERIFFLNIFIVHYWKNR